MTDPSAVLRSVGAVFDHVAHALPEIRPHVPLYRDILGGAVDAGGINPWGGHLAVHFVFPGGGRIELLEPVRPDSPSVGAFLARNPRGGLHHLTFKVEDFDTALSIVTAAGLQPFGTLAESESWKETYLHPRATGGVLIQLAQAAPGIPPLLGRPLDEVLDEAEGLRRAAGM